MKIVWHANPLLNQLLDNTRVVSIQNFSRKSHNMEHSRVGSRLCYCIVMRHETTPKVYILLYFSLNFRLGQPIIRIGQPIIQITKQSSDWVNQYPIQQMTVGCQIRMIGWPNQYLSEKYSSCQASFGIYCAKWISP